MNFLLAVLVLASSAQAAPVCSEGIKAAPGKFCDNVADCMKFCSCQCTFDKTKWKAKVHNDGSTNCPGLPETGFGMVAHDSGDLHDVPKLDHIDMAKGVRATQDVIDGLTRLNTRLANPQIKRDVKFGVYVKNCYRRHETDTVPECGFVLKAKYMLAKTDLTDENRRYWEGKANPMNLGLAWPGRTPHSGGYACDIILVDKKGADCFDWRAGVDDAPTCSIPAKDAAKLLADEITGDEVGGKRLSYEAWHFEWGPNASGCRGDACNRWPITGKP